MRPQIELLKDLVRQSDFASIFWVVYIVALIFSFLGVVISSKLRHEREIKRILRKFEEARRDPASVWPYEEEERY